MNLILATDSYKLTHWKQYPPGTETVYSYLESRGGHFNDTVWFGLQALLRKLTVPITYADIDEAHELSKLHFGADHFNRAGWLHILNKHHGRLPVEIRALPEGSIVPTLTPLMSVQNTDPACFWLTNHLETLLAQAWYPTTVATLSRAVKIRLLKALERTGDPAGIGFKLHDFGCRGVSSMESAAIGGLAHLVNFLGTDTLPALLLARDVYDEPCAGFSIPASEHSTITSWLRPHERDAYRNMLDQYPIGPLACVSDSYDLFHACEQYWGVDLKERVMGRDGFLVVRPDSGYPPHIVVQTLDALGSAFGASTNSKGFKVLDPHVRVIQGDGMNLDMIDEVIHQLIFRNWSLDNVAFGMGGGLLQQVNRDTCKFAFKCSAALVNGEWRDVFKEPVTDMGKRSKAGRFEGVGSGVP